MKNKIIAFSAAMLLFCPSAIWALDCYQKFAVAMAHALVTYEANREDCEGALLQGPCLTEAEYAFNQDTYNAITAYNDCLIN